MKRSREQDEDLESATEDETSHNGSRQTSVDPTTERATKIVGLDEAADAASEPPIMRCSLPPHKEPLAFRSYRDYEAHYHSFHLNRCIECRKNFPSEHLLSVHIEECHDPLIRVRRDKGEHTFSCFVEGCERKCLTHQKRRMHLIDKHMYPKNYFFGITKDGIDGRKSLINDAHRQRRSSVASQMKVDARPDKAEATKQTEPSTTTSAQADKKDVDTDMEGLTGAMSSLKFIPSNVRFGRGRAGFAKS